MKSKLFHSALALVGLSEAIQHVSEMPRSNSDTLLDKRHNIIVKSFGYEYPEFPRSYTLNENTFQFEFDANIDLSIGYQVLMFYYRKEQADLMVLNPNMFLELASHIFINFRLYFVDIGIRADINGYKIKPVDY